MNSFQFVHRQLCASPSESNIIGLCISCPKQFLVWQKYKPNIKCTRTTTIYVCKSKCRTGWPNWKHEAESCIRSPTHSQTKQNEGGQTHRNAIKIGRKKKPKDFLALVIKLNSKIVVWNMCFWVLALTFDRHTLTHRIAIRTASDGKNISRLVLLHYVFAADVIFAMSVCH